MSKGKRYEVIEEKSWHTVFIGTEQQVDAYIENPDHDETYIIREVKDYAEANKAIVNNNSVL